jgi:hypothetical protein
MQPGDTDAGATSRRGTGLGAAYWGFAQVYPRLVGGLLVYAAILKLWDNSGVWDVLEFDGIPAILISPLIYILATGEAFLGLLLIALPSLKWGLWCTVGLLGAYTLQLAWLAGSADAPGCACFGALEAYKNARTQNLIGIARNVCLALPLVCLLIWPVHRKPDVSAEAR